MNYNNFQMTLITEAEKYVSLVCLIKVIFVSSCFWCSTMCLKLLLDKEKKNTEEKKIIHQEKGFWQ